MRLYSTTKSARVVRGTVTETGTFAELIAPASPFREGFPAARAKNAFGVYPISRLQYDRDTEELTTVAAYYDSDDDKVYTHTKALTPVARRKAAMLRATTAKRRAQEAAGITISGASIDTDNESQAKLSGALQLVQDDDTVVIDWREADGSWTRLNATAVTAVARAVGRYIQACFSRERALNIAINNATTHAALDLIDIEAGSINGSGSWPS